MKLSPYYIVVIRKNGKLQGYELWLEVQRGQQRKILPLIPRGPRLKRHEIYAVARLLNGQQSVRKWAEKFEDPYV